MLNTLRIAVLECDTPADAVIERRGSYGDIFTRLLNSGKEGLGTVGQGVDLLVSKWDVVTAQVYPDVAEVDCVLLTGSRHSAYHDDPWILKLVEFVRVVTETSSIPIIGICFGHQIVARAFGAKIGSNDKGWELAVEDIALTPEGKEVFRVESLALQEMHRDVVLELPEGFVNLGYTSRCAVQGMCKPGRVLTVQAHPELDEFIIQYLLDTRHKQGILDDRVFDDAWGRSSLRHDGILVSEAILRFALSATGKGGSP